MHFLAQYAQTEYNQSYGLVALFLLLGLMVICIPRPRRADFINPEEERKKKIERAQAKKKKRKDKKKKKKAKSKPKPKPKPAS